MELPKPFQITNDVWMVPCQMKKNRREYIPMLPPYKNLPSRSSSKSRQGWKSNEDQVLQELVEFRGARNWSSLAKELNAKVHNSFPSRKGKQCRERWINHLNPELQKHKWTDEEDEIIRVMQKQVGNKWSVISKILSSRTENQIKNRWKMLKKKVEEEIDNREDLAINSFAFEKFDYDDGLETFVGGSPYSLDDIDNLGCLSNEIKRLDCEFLEINSKKYLNPKILFSFASDPDASMNLGLELVQSFPGSKCEFSNVGLEKSGTNVRNPLDGPYQSLFSDHFTLSWSVESETNPIFNLASDKDRDFQDQRSRKSSFMVDSDVEISKVL